MIPQPLQSFARRVRGMGTPKLQTVSLDEVCWNPNVELKLRKWSQDPGAGGFMDSIVIASVALSKKPRIYFEIGTGDGRSALLVSANTPETTQIFTLDPFFPEDPIKGSVFHGEPEATKIQQFGGYSTTFDFSSWMNGVDLVFVDGSHDYADVVSDTALAFRMIAPGGWILWHDVAMDCPGVVKALEQSEHSRKIRKIAGTRYAIHRSEAAPRAFAATAS